MVSLIEGILVEVWDVFLRFNPQLKIVVLGDGIVPELMPDDFNQAI